MNEAHTLCDLSAVELRRLIGTKAISPVAVLESCLERIDAVNPKLNAITATCIDRARAEAKTAETAALEGEALGPLHGLPIGIKDLQETEGVTTTFGSKLYEHNVPARDERTVAAVRRAGAIVVGKTNVPEWGAGANTNNPVYGATGNPFAPDLICGGSSGGAAVALATSMLPLATGSDTGGSLRTPAAYCGVVGFRSTPGLVPSERRGHGWTPISVLGPMGRTVADTCLLLSAMVDSDTRDPFAHAVEPDDFVTPVPTDLASLHLALSEDLGFAPVAQTIRETFRERAPLVGTHFKSTSDTAPLLKGADEIFETIRAVNFLASHHERYENNPESLGPNTRANYEQGMAMSLADFAHAHMAQTKLYREAQAFFNEVDVLICPGAAVSPFPWTQLYVEEIDGQKLRTYFHWLAITYGLTLLGHPVAAIPCGLDAHGLPFGIQICGPKNADRFVLGVAHALELALAANPATARPVPDIESF
ncbi:MAG: amidase family protein [Pseudomonadota bacterium]